MYKRAIELDPDYARAYAYLAWTHLNDWRLGWSEDRERSLELALALAQRAIAVDDSDPYAHSALGDVYLWKKRYAQAIAELERTIALNPNDADGYSALGDILTWVGKPEEAVRYVETGMRLNPNYPFIYLWHLGHAYFAMRQYEKAIPVLQQVRDRNPNFSPAYIYLAASYGQLGRLEEAQAEMARVRKLIPDWSEAHLRAVLPYKDPVDLEHLLDALRKVGLPE